RQARERLCARGAPAVARRVATDAGRAEPTLAVHAGGAHLAGAGAAAGRAGAAVDAALSSVLDAVVAQAAGAVGSARASAPGAAGRGAVGCILTLAVVAREVVAVGG